MCGAGSAVGAYAAALADAVQLQSFFLQTTFHRQTLPAQKGDTAMSNFEPNAVIRGFQLTIVGSECNLNSELAGHQLQTLKENLKWSILTWMFSC